jgi:hypothetical protein
MLDGIDLFLCRVGWRVGEWLACGEKMRRRMWCFRQRLLQVRENPSCFQVKLKRAAALLCVHDTHQSRNWYTQ